MIIAVLINALSSSIIAIRNIFSTTLLWIPLNFDTFSILNVSLVAQENTTITMPFGLFEFRRMPFGLRNATQTFLHFMDQVLHGLDFCYVYIDDVITSHTPEEHKEHLCLVLQHFDLYGIIINPTKCVLGVNELQFLGHHVTQYGLSPLPDQVQVIRDFPQPNTLCQVREFLGMVKLKLLPQIHSPVRCHPDFAQLTAELYSKQQPYSTVDHVCYRGLPRDQGCTGQCHAPGTPQTKCPCQCHDRCIRCHHWSGTTTVLG